MLSLSNTSIFTKRKKYIFSLLFLFIISAPFYLFAQCNPDVDFSGHYFYGKIKYIDDNFKFTKESPSSEMIIKQNACDSLLIYVARQRHAKNSIIGNPIVHYRLNALNSTGLFKKNQYNIRYHMEEENIKFMGVLGSYWDEYHNLHSMKIVLEFPTSISSSNPNKNILENYLQSIRGLDASDINTIKAQYKNLKTIISNSENVSLKYFFYTKLSKDPIGSFSDIKIDIKTRRYLKKYSFVFEEYNFINNNLDSNEPLFLKYRLEKTKQDITKKNN